MILQRYYGLGDKQIEYQIIDRISFKKFLGIETIMLINHIMKTKILGIAIAATLMFTACHKDSVQPAQPQNPNANTQTPPASIVKFYLNGTTEIQSKDFIETDNSITIEGFEKNVVYFFDNEEKMLNWCSQQHNETAKIITEKFKNMHIQLNAAVLAGVTNDEKATEEFMNQWRKNHPAAKTMGDGQFFTETNLAGSLMSLPGTLPNLGSTFNNNLESCFLVTSPTTLCDRKCIMPPKKSCYWRFRFFRLL
jgi:uncharacterized short protein YbdD (DUF466 family)